MAADKKDRKLLLAVDKAAQKRERYRVAHQAARMELSDTLRAAREGGYTLAELGAAVGLSRQRVYELAS